MDFSLLEKVKSFKIDRFFPFIIEEFDALGIKINLRSKNKKGSSSNIESAFLKNDTQIHTLDIKVNNLDSILNGVYSGKIIKIKLEVDTNPPLKFQTETKTLLLPITFNIISMTLPNLYAGKMHAVLCRKWKSRVKGRDWYDFEWYVKRSTKLNLEHLEERMKGSGDLDDKQNLTPELFKELMYAKIDALQIEKAIEEVKPFIKDTSVFQYWTIGYFKLLTDKILFQ